MRKLIGLGAVALICFVWIVGEGVDRLRDLGRVS